MIFDLLKLFLFLVLVVLEAGLVSGLDQQVAPADLEDEERVRRRVELLLAIVLAVFLGWLW